MSAGWIKLHRQIQESAFYGQPLALAIWVECLMRASHESRERFLGREKVYLPAGSFVMGYREFADRVGVGVATVKAWLDAFEKEGMVERRRNAKGTFVQLKKWTEYQDSRTLTEKPRNIDGTTAEPNKKEKKVENVKKAAPQKSEPTDERRSTEERFKQCLVSHGWCDEAYADKTWTQGMAMSDRTEFLRKVGVMLAWANSEVKRSKAKPMFHEIAGFVNDQGAMRQQLTARQQDERDEFSADH